MAIIEPMSSLEAVNKMLSAIGQAPVNTINVAGVGDAAKAVQQLLEVTREVQTVGWSFNTDYAIDLPPNPTDSSIVVPLQALDIDASAATTTVVQRRHPSGSMALYDADNHTFAFTAAVTVDILWGWPFDDLPQPARSYIATAASRRFQAQILSSPVLDRFNAIDEDRAWTMLQRYERRSRDTNSFRKSASLSRWTKKRSLSNYTPG